MTAAEEFSPQPLGPLVPTSTEGIATATSTSAAPLASPTVGEPFAEQFARLQQLGAQYYLLETWGAQPGLYRFHCKMSLAGNSGYVRHFEATDSDPSEAVAKVVTEVEAWRRQTR